MRRYFHRSDEAVTPAWNGLNESWIFSGIAEGVTQLVHGGVQAVVVIDECVRRPKKLPQFFPRHHIAGASEKLQKDFERLPLEAWAGFAVLAKLTRGAFQFVEAEAKNGLLIGWIGH